MPTDDEPADWNERARQAREDIARMAAEEVIQNRDELREERRARQSRGQVREPRGKDTVVSCRLDANSLDALDTLVEAGVRTTRADAAAWLIQVGIETKQQLLTDLVSTVSEIRRLRQDAANKARSSDGSAGGDGIPHD